VKPWVAGQRYQFVENRPAPLPPGEALAHVDAIDPLTAHGTESRLTVI
jgi:hypothetical protein